MVKTYCNKCNALLLSIDSRMYARKINTVKVSFLGMYKCEEEFHLCAKCYDNMIDFLRK